MIEFTITTTYPPEALIQLPELGRKKEIIQLERNWEPVERADTLEQTHYHYRLTSFELGTHQISTNSILFTYQGETGEEFANDAQDVLGSFLGGDDFFDLIRKENEPDSVVVANR